MGNARVHLEGMGLVGSILALEFYEHGVDFTWSDVNTYRTAWKACTGAVFPTGHHADEYCRMQWQMIPPELPLAQFTETVPFVFGSKNPPHEGRYAYSSSLFGLNIAGQDKSGNPVLSTHLNAQELVPFAQEKFADRMVPQWDREKGAPQADIYLITHGRGFGGSEWWGWTVPVRIKTVDPTLPARAAFYKHLGPVGGPNYAYPIPGTDLWYSGSTLRRSTKHFPIQVEYDKWEKRFLDWTKGAVEVEQVGEPVEGWRPSAIPTALSKEVPDDWLVEMPGRENTYRVWPCATDGVRRAPLYVAAVKELLAYGRSRSAAT